MSPTGPLDEADSDARLRARVTPHVTVLEADPGPYVRLDAAGRWTAFGRAGAAYRRALDGGVLRRTARGFAVCSPRAADAVNGEVRDALRDLTGQVAEPEPRGLALLGSLPDLRERLAQAAAWTPRRLAQHAARLRAAYPEATPILPPHRYRDLVILPATGCPHHQCTFCGFYRDRPFRALDDAAFDAHLAAVCEALGPALGERDGVFLGSASALSLPDAILDRRLASLTAVLGSLRRGVAAFLDPDHAPRRQAEDWARLRAAGLVEATVGLETGLPALRRAVGKSPAIDPFVRRVRRVKEGGVRICVTVLLGLGGEAHALAHRSATMGAIARMQLDAGDRVYLSPLDDGGGATLPPAPMRAWRDALNSVTPARVRPYLVERFAWLT